MVIFPWGSSWYNTYEVTLTLNITWEFVSAPDISDNPTTWTLMHQMRLISIQSSNTARTSTVNIIDKLNVEGSPVTPHWCYSSFITRPWSLIALPPLHLLPTFALARHVYWAAVLGSVHYGGFSQIRFHIASYMVKSEGSMGELLRHRSVVLSKSEPS